MTDMKLFFLFMTIILASWWDSHRITNLEAYHIEEQDND